MMLGESEYKHQLEADIRPYRDILLGLFFITVGMKLDMSSFIIAIELTRAYDRFYVSESDGY